jgi:threonine/homoserine/homoserine lactone efflux protein
VRLAFNLGSTIEMHSDLAGFAGVAALVTIAPAADFALVSRRAIGEGVRTAVITASGVCRCFASWTRRSVRAGAVRGGAR